MKITGRLLTGLGAITAVAMTASAYDISVRGKDGQIFQASVDNIKIMDFDSAESPLRFDGAYTNNIRIGNRAQDITVTFDAAMYWIVSDFKAEEWYRIGTWYGKGGESSITVSVDANILAAPRTSSFTVLCGFCPVEFTITQDVNADPGVVDIPDENFLAYCLEKFDIDKNKVISTEEASKVKSIDVTGKGIKSLSGIRSFGNLEELVCSYNEIEGTLDLSGLTKLKRVDCDHNLYSTLNVSGCSALETLKGNDNYKVEDDFKYIFTLETVMLQGCSSLRDLNLEDNALQALDFTDCPNLQELRLSVNKLRSIDLTQNSKLVNAHIRRNTFDENFHLDLTKCAALRTIFLSESNLGSIDVSGCNNLEILDLTYNRIRSIDLSRCPALKRFEIFSNELTEIDLSKCPELTSLWIAANNISKLDLSKNPKLETLLASDNGIDGALDLTNNKRLVKVEMYKNKISELKMVPMATLEHLVINNNNLKILDLSGMTGLVSFVAYENELESVNLTNCGSITVMNLDNNPLSSIDLSDCVSLVSVDMSKCAFTTLDLTASKQLVELYVNYNQLKNIKLKDLDRLGVLEIYNNQLERLDLRGCTSLSQIHMHNNNIEYFSPRVCPALSYIDCRNNRIKGIDFSSNDYLDRAYGKGNPCSIVYLSEMAPNSFIEFDESCEIYLGTPKDFDDVGGADWGDADIDPWN